MGEYNVVGIVQCGLYKKITLEAILADMLEKVVYEYENNLLAIDESIMSRFKEEIQIEFPMVDNIDNAWFDEMINLPYPSFNVLLKEYFNSLTKMDVQTLKVKLIIEPCSNGLIRKKRKKK